MSSIFKHPLHKQNQREYSRFRKAYWAAKLNSEQASVEQKEHIHDH